MSTIKATKRQTQAPTNSATQMPAIKRIFLGSVMLVLPIVSDFGGGRQGFTWFHRFGLKRIQTTQTNTKFQLLRFSLSAFQFFSVSAFYEVPGPRFLFANAQS